METRSKQPQYTADLKPATQEGFAQAVAQANVSHAAGYRLVAMLRLGDAIASVYALQEPKTGDSFFDM